MPEPLTPEEIAELPWVYDGIFGPLSALPPGFKPAPKVKPARSFDELAPWAFDEAFATTW